MKILVLSAVLGREATDRIRECAANAGAEVCFAASEDSVPEEFRSPDILYGFGMRIARTCENLKWLCVPSAGVDYLMKPDTFANKDCILTNSSGAYGVTIAEHMIAVTLMMMRRLATYYEETHAGIWGKERYRQRSLFGTKISVLGTGDIGRSFAKRARAFGPDTRLLGR